jgi:hypothetical protein
MPKNDDELLIRALHKLDALEEVPSSVSKNFDKTLSRLVYEHEATKGNSQKRSGVLNFSIAASFFVVVAFGTVVTLNSQSEISVTSNPSETSGQPNPSTTSDQNLYSNNSDSGPKISSEPIQLINSKTNYELINVDIARSLGIDSSWNSTDKLEPDLRTCLKNLQVSQNLSTIDQGVFKGLNVRAAWSPLNLDSWNVYIIDSNCEVLEKKFVGNSN